MRLGQYYVKITNPVNEIDKEYREILNKAQGSNLAPDGVSQNPETEFIAIHEQDNAVDEFGSCKKYSIHYGEAKFIGVNDKHDIMISYEHWERGELTRSLKYSNGEWRVAGEPEDWEERVLFSDELLDKHLDDWDLECHDEIKSVWQRKRIRTGDCFPSIHPSGLYRKVMELI